MMQDEWIALLVFTVCYVLFVVLPNRRSVVACAGGAVLVAAGVLTWHAALAEMVQWNVVALFVGTLVLADLFLESRAPAALAEWFIRRTRTLRGAMLAVCSLASFLSIFIENVAVVLLVAPIAVSLTEKLKISPVRLLIGIAVCSNLQGTATLIGDPPSMILAGYMKMNFNDFFIYQGKPGIFFAVQMGALASLGILAYMFREHNEPVASVAQEEVKAWVPSALLGFLVLGLATTSIWDPDFKWLAGTLTMVLAVVGLVWDGVRSGRGAVGRMLKSLDWDTTFFLIGIFVVVGGLSECGILGRLAAMLSSQFGSNVIAAFLAIVGVSVVCSAFVDNVPFLLVMIPVVQQVADTLTVPVPFLMFGLLIGACLGGNITPIGASANIVAMGILKKRGHPVSFGAFVRLGVPFTAAAVLAACLFIWLAWGP